VYEALAPVSRLHLLGGGDLVVLAVLLGAWERLLALAGLPRRRRWVLAGSAVAFAVFSESAFAVAFLAAAALFLSLLVAAIVRRLAGWRRAAALAGLGLALVLALQVLVVMTGLVGALASRSPAGTDDDVAMTFAKASRLDRAEKHRGELDDALAQSIPATAGPEAPAASVVARAGYEGLPARITLPPGARRTTFARELLGTDAPRPVYVLLVSASLVAALTAALGLLLAVLAVAFRGDLAEGARAFRARLAIPRAASPAPDAAR
jgi:hypothetical protein